MRMFLRLLIGTRSYLMLHFRHLQSFTDRNWSHQLLQMKYLLLLTCNTDLFVKASFDKTLAGEVTEHRSHAPSERQYGIYSDFLIKTCAAVLSDTRNLYNVFSRKRISRLF
jgi:hypothetical protein